MRDDVTVDLKHNGKLIRSVETTLDTMHKLIGVMTYGGWKPNDQTKFIVDDYHFVSLQPFIVEVNLLTEAEFEKRTAEKMTAQFEGLSKEFQSKLIPPFKRNPGDLN